jgi:hypothetical protein
LKYEVGRYYWDEPFLFRRCNDGIYRRCVTKEEGQDILSKCHDSTYGGHLATSRTIARVLQSGFFWPSMFKDAHYYVKHCDSCQRRGTIDKKDEMPLNTMQEVEIFDV